MTYPNFAGKHAEEPLFTPSDFVAYLRQIGQLAEASATPPSVILCYQRTLYEHVLRAEGVEGKALPPRRGYLRGLVPLPSTGGSVGVLGRFGIGAPAAVAALEELAALGTKAGHHDLDQLRMASPRRARSTASDSAAA